MFDIGFSELLVIAVVALVVLGPERLPKAARFAGLWVRRARAQWNSVKDELERELAADELKRELQQARDALNRNESCGGHFREESATEEGEAKRDDENYTYVSCWEYKGEGNEPVLHKEELKFENIKLSQRSYK